MDDFLYHYNAKVVRVYDGDTMTLDIDLGLRTWRLGEVVRLYGINTPEIRGEERPEGLRITEIVRGWCPIGSDVVVETYLDKTGKYGRWLGRINLADGRCVNDMLIQMGFAHDY